MALLRYTSLIRAAGVIALVIAAAAPNLGAQDLSIIATVDKRTVAVGQPLVLTLTINGATNVQGAPDLPNIPGTSRAGGVSRSTSMSIVNGQVTRSIAFRYTLLPTRAGTLQIPVISLSLSGQAYHTQPISVAVTNAPAPPAGRGGAAPGQPGGQLTSDLIFIRAEVDKSEAYQNEGITVSYKIYTSVDVTQYNVEQLPTEGFWSEEYPLPPQPTLRPVVLDGMRYQAAEIKRLELFPTTPGELTIDPMILTATVRMPAARQRSRSLFDQFFNDPFFSRGQRQNVSLATRPITITVKPLPAAGRPASFGNAVGQFSLTATADQTAVTTDDAVTLTVRLEGTGNVKLAELPPLSVSSDFEVYDPKIAEEVQRSGSDIRGHKTYEYVLIPRNPGAQRIHSMTLSYFDPAAQAYKTATTPEIMIDVTRGRQPLAAVPSNLTREEVRLIGSDIRFITVEAPEWLPVGVRFYHGAAFWLAACFPLLIISGAVGYRRHIDRLESDSGYRRRRSAGSLANKRLRMAETAPGPTAPRCTLSRGTGSAPHA